MTSTTVSGAPSDLQTVLERLVEVDVLSAIALVRGLGAAAAPEAHVTAEAYLTTALAEERQLESEVDAMVARARAAQAAFEHWTDERVDDLLRDLAETFAARAEDLARATVQETGLGNVRDKTEKNRFASLAVYQSIAGKPAQGPIGERANRRITELASPVGVVLGVVPVTNPVATAIFKTLIALKSRNALILSFHRRALGLARTVGDLVRRELAAHGAPVDLVQWPEQRADRRLTRKLMSHEGVSLILATGGPGLVRAAYASGTPAIGVGSGNAPAWICADADLARAARAIVASKTFDNGLICGAEHNLVVDDRVVEPFTEALERIGAAVLTPAETDRVAPFLVDAERASIRREFIGQSAARIAAAVEIRRTYDIRLLVLPVRFAGSADPYAREKLAPILSLFAVAGEDEGLRLGRALLENDGAGHTAAIHTTNLARIERFARAMPASRILVNTPAAQGCCGSTTGLDCSMTLGCGTFGGGSTTDNVTYRHLLNVKRVAHHIERRDRPAPGVETFIWS
jgi:acyl-CoA reductase-like NAD-dependent aldehyde dehydrogenase